MSKQSIFSANFLAVLIKSAVLMIVLALLVPIMTIVAYVFQPNGALWQHLIETVLFEYIQNSVILALIVSLIACILGISTAWLSSAYRFFGDRFIPLLLMLPMAMPSYIIAFTYSGILSSTGVIQEFIRARTGLGVQEYWFIEVHNVYGAGVMLGLVLYPYVFLLARASFMTQSVHQMQAAELLGLNKREQFYKVALPMARPAIVAGLALVVMETLSDYGTVQYYGVPTFTTGIFRTWYGLNDVASAVNLSALLLLFVLLLFGIEAFSRRQTDYNHNEKSPKDIATQQRTPTPLKQGLILLWCLLPFLLGFGIPMIQLGAWAIANLHAIDAEFIRLCYHSFLLAIVTASIAVTMVFSIYAYQRYTRSRLVKQSFRLVALGYAIPGVVVAIGVMIPAGLLGDTLNQLLNQLNMGSIGLLHGTFSLLVFAYLVRFSAVALGSIESGYNKINPVVDDAARLLGARFFALFFRIHLPMMTKVLLTAVLIIFVDVLKELPIALVLRPFNYNTLAVKSFELANDEFLAQAALPAIAIVATGIIPVYLLNLGMHKHSKT